MKSSVAVLAAIAWIAAAQGRLPQTPFGCEESRDKNGPFIRDTGLRFEPITDPKRIAEITRLPSKSLAGFAASYQVDTVRVFAAVSSPESEEFSQLEPATVTLYLGLSRSDGSHYFALRPKEDERFDIAAENEQDLSRLDLLPATPDKTFPLVVLSISSHSGGVNVGGDRTLLHLIDVSGPQPHSVAAIDCDFPESYSSYCPERHLDDANVSYRLACEWSTARQDFVCTQVTSTHWDWGDTEVKAMFYVRSTDRIWPREVDTSGPTDLQTWGAALQRGTNLAGRHIVLPELGDTFVLDRLRGSDALLVASRGETNNLMPKFHLIHGRSGRMEELPVQTLEPTLSHSARQSVPPGILTGPRMRFAVKRLQATSAGVIFDEVLVMQEGHHSVFWVAIDVRNTQHSRALLIATDAMDSTGTCPYALITASAARATWIGRLSRLVTLDVEPTRYVNTYCERDCYAVQLPSEDSRKEVANKCSYEVAVRWSTSDGWVLNKKDRPCDEEDIRVRAISISDSGSLKASPAGLEKPDVH
jgi:hypothetical protein